MQSLLREVYIDLPPLCQCLLMLAFRLQSTLVVRFTPLLVSPEVAHNFLQQKHDLSLLCW